MVTVPIALDTFLWYHPLWFQNLFPVVSDLYKRHINFCLLGDFIWIVSVSDGIMLLFQANDQVKNSVRLKNVDVYFLQNIHANKTQIP